MGFVRGFAWGGEGERRETWEGNEGGNAVLSNTYIQGKLKAYPVVRLIILSRALRVRDLVVGVVLLD